MSTASRLQGWLGPLAVGALLLVAFHPLVQAFLALPAGKAFGDWLFRPGSMPIPLVVSLGAWLALRRRARLLALPRRSARATTCLLLALGALIFVWALLTRASDLLLPSLAVQLLAFATLARGVPGLRCLLLPAAVLLLGVRIPAPLHDELVWQLQLLTAAGTSGLLQLLGRELAHGGMVIQTTQHTFYVIEECSGLRGVQILTLAALAVRELFAAHGRRLWWVVILGPPLGVALNVARTALIALSAEPQRLAGQSVDHTPQGVGVLILGSVLLYGLGLLLSTTKGVREAAPGPTPTRPAPLPWRFAALWLAPLAIVAHGLPPFELPKLEPARIAFPMEAAGWRGEAVPMDAFFLGAQPARMVARRYSRPTRQRGDAVVDVFIGIEHSPGASNLLTSKLLRPGPEWALRERRAARLWSLSRDGELAVAAAAEGALVYHWRLRDRGLWREAWRSLLALDQTPFRRSPGRAVVRLATPLARNGPLARGHAKRTLDRFVEDFSTELEAL